MAFNVPVDNEQTLGVLQSFVGSSLQLSTHNGRLWRHEDWRYIVLTWNPIITLVSFSNQTKQQLCQYFSANGHIVLPSGDAATHLIRGSNKPVPTTTFLLALLDAGVEFIRLVNFGMKMKLNTFPDLPRDLLDCQATHNGYPPNEWDISLSHRTDFLYLIKPHAPYPLHVMPNPYPILTPLNPNPRVTLGGNLNLSVTDDGPIKSLKIYNLQYHLLRASNLQPLNATITTRQGGRAYENMYSILVAMREARQLIGGLRMEVRAKSC